MDAGYIAVPFMPVFKGMSKEFAKNLTKPAEAAGKRAGKAIESGVGDAVKSLERQVAASEQNLKKFERASEAAQAKQEQKKQALKVVTLELQAAEEKYQKAVASGNSGTAELAKVERAKGKVLKATTDLAAAEGDAKAAAKKYEDQQKDLSDTSAKLQKAQEDAAKGIDKTTDAMGDGDEKAKSFKDSIMKIGVSVGAAIGALGGLGKAAYSLGKTFDDAYDTIRVGTGASGKALDGLQESLRNVAENSVGVGGDIAEIGTTLADLNTRLGVTGEPLERLTSQFQQLQGMGIDADINKVTGALQQFGIEGEAAPAAMDNLFRISQATGRSITEITDNLSKSGPALKQFGFGLEESAGLLGALDKAGLDSEKTLGSMTKALGVFAKEGKNPQEALQGTIREIDGLVKAGDNVKAIDLANKIFGARGGAGFVAAVESGKLEYEDFMDSIGASGDTIDGVASETADFAEKWDQFKLKAMFALEPVAMAVFDMLGPALDVASGAMSALSSLVTDKLVPAFKSFGEWLQKNEAWIKPLAAVVGTLAGAFGVLAVQAKLAAAAQAVMTGGGLLKWFTSLTAVTKAQTAAQAAWNMVTKANPLFLIVSAIAAVVAGLAIFFTKTEKGRELWSGFMEHLKAAGAWLQETFAPLFAKLGEFFTGMFEALQVGWDAFVSGVSALWEGVLQPVLSAVFEVAKVTIGAIATAILTPLMLAWEALATAIQWAWENVIKPVWDALAESAQWLWESVLQPTFDAIKTAWESLSNAIQWYWENVTRPALEVMGQVFQWLYNNAIKPVVEAIKAAWEMLSQAIMWAWENVIKVAFPAMGNFVQWVWNSLLRPTFDAIKHAVGLVGEAFKVAWENVIKPAWDALGRGIKLVIDKVVKPAFHGLQNALDTLKGWFDKTVDAIGKTWNRIKELTKKPIQFVVNTVYNNGIRKAWNSVGKLVGLDSLPEHKFARGGILPGYTPGRDPYTFIEPTTGMQIGLSGGEAVIRPEATRVLGEDWVDGVNAAARMGGAQGVKRWLGGFSGGGVIGSITRIVNEKFPMMTITSTLRPGDPGHHGAGRAVDFSNGFDSTPEMRSAAGYFASNYGKELLELIHSPFNANIKNGQSVGDGFGFYGAGTMNEHRNHVHVAASQPLAGGGKGGVLGFLGGAIDFVGDQVKKIWDKIINPIKEKIPSPAGIIGKYPKAAFDKLTSKAWEFIMSKIPGRSAEGAYNGPVGAGVEQWRPLVEKVLKAKGYDVALTDTVLRRMNQESGGDPRAINNWDSNAAAGTPSKGLMQVIDPTFQANKDPGYDNIWDPEANLRASMNYTSRRYGSLPAGYNRAGGYADGGVIDLLNHFPTRLYDRGGWLMPGERALNLSGKPEPVFTNAQWGVLSRGLLSIGDMVPPLKTLTRDMARQVSAFEKWVAKAADPATLEGVSLRSFAAEVTEIIGMLGGEHTSAVLKSLIEGEKNLWDTRQAHAARLKDIKDKEEALKEARKALADAKSSETKAAKKDAKAQAKNADKIAKAEKKLAEARKGKDKDKIADAEKNLADLRKDTADKSKEAEEKRAEEAKTAADNVAKAEADLAQARMESARALDITLHDLNPGIEKMLKDSSKLAGQHGLGGVASVLSQMAYLAGPSGMTVGYAIELTKTAINVVKTIVTAVKALIEKFHKARVAARQAVADSWEAIAKYAQLTHDLQVDVSKLRQSLVRGAMEQRDAEFKLRVAQQDRLVAEAEGAVAVAKARLALDAEIRKGAIAAQLKLRGLQEDWDTYMSWQAMESQGVLKSWSDAAIRAVYEYEAARAQAMRAELQARLEIVNAEAALAAAQRQNARNQQDLLVAQERLIRMSAKVAGVDLVEATGGAQASKLLLELFEAQTELNRNVLGRWGYKMGADGSYANEYRGQMANRDNLQQALNAVLAESGITLDGVEMAQLFKLMERVSRRGGDPMDVIRAQLPRLVEAEGALRTHEALKPIYDARDSLRDQERQVEDFRAEMDLYEKTAPLEKAIQGLTYTVKSLEHTADAYAEGAEGVRGELLRSAEANRSAGREFGVDWRLDSQYAGASQRVRSEVTVHMEGDRMYTAEQVDEMLAEISRRGGVPVRTVIRASDVAARRKELI